MIAIVIGAVVVGIYYKPLFRNLLMGPLHTDFITYQVMCQIGQKIGAEEALSWGLIDRILPAEDLLPAARALAMAAAIKGYKMTLIMPDNMSEERRASMKAYGAEIILTPAAGSMEAAMHLTGRYPGWWTGATFPHATTGWAASETSQGTRDTVQRREFEISTRDSVSGLQAQAAVLDGVGAEARGQVALFLGLTMLPFAIVAPLCNQLIVDDVLATGGTAAATVSFAPTTVGTTPPRQAIKRMIPG